ncbi:hypothetical protein AC519_5483 [Pseudomonas savastanoi]|nr:hypothetical protein AC519_5483 [Pseudomonas savastanoi]
MLLKQTLTVMSKALIVWHIDSGRRCKRGSQRNGEEEQQDHSEGMKIHCASLQ